MSKKKKLKVALIGTNGIPAAYGGYETLVENLVLQIGHDYDFTVYCSKTQKRKHYIKNREYLNARLLYSFFDANGLQSVFYDVFSLIRSSFKDDVLVYLGPGAGFILPIIRILGCKKNIIVNHGGLNEWEREKLSSFERMVAKIGHKCAARYSTYNIADNNLYRESLKKNFGTDSIVIRYGGDHAQKVQYNKDLLAKYPFLDKEYAVSVSRAQVDNNLHVVLEAYSKMPNKILVLVSNWQVSDYGKQLRDKYYQKYPNIYVLDAIYNPVDINAIRSNALFYIHSHSRCGTAPSLCEAMSLGLAIIAFDVPVNHEVTRDNALFFNSPDSLVSVVNSVSAQEVQELAAKSKQIAEEEFKWSHIANLYQQCIEKKYDYGL